MNEKTDKERKYWEILTREKYRVISCDYTVGILKKGIDTSELVKLGEYEEITNYI